MSHCGAAHPDPIPVWKLVGGYNCTMDVEVGNLPTVATGIIIVVVVAAMVHSVYTAGDEK